MFRCKMYKNQADSSNSPEMATGHYTCSSIEVNHLRNISIAALFRKSTYAVSKPGTLSNASKNLGTVDDNDKIVISRTIRTSKINDSIQKKSSKIWGAWEI